MLVTTSRVSDGRGCLAHLVSDSMTVDGNAWHDMGTVIVSDSEKQPECPDWFRMGEYYYITYAYGGKSHYAFSHDRFGEGGWIVPENNLIPCGNVPKSALSDMNGFLRVLRLKTSAAMPEMRYLYAPCREATARLNSCRFRIKTRQSEF